MKVAWEEKGFIVDNLGTEAQLASTSPSSLKSSLSPPASIQAKPGCVSSMKERSGSQYEAGLEIK